MKREKKNKSNNGSPRRKVKNFSLEDDVPSTKKSQKSSPKPEIEEILDIKFSGNVADDTVAPKKKSAPKKKKPMMDPNIVEFDTNVKDEPEEGRKSKSLFAKKDKKVQKEKVKKTKEVEKKTKKTPKKQIDDEPENWIIKSNLLNFEAIKKRITHRKNRDFLLKVLIITFIIIAISIVASRYLTSTEFRDNVDTNIGKKVDKESVATIASDSNNIMAFGQYIGVLNKSGLVLYDVDGKEQKTLDVSISSPKHSTKNKYLALAEEKGNKIYLINDSIILWKKEIEGEISNIDVNENGYVSVIIKNSSSKSMVMLFNKEGKEVCEYYLAFTYAVSTSVSPNNKYLAIGEVDYSGTIIKSKIEILSIDKAIQGDKDPIINRYESEASEIVNNVNYVDNENAIGMFNKYIQKVRSDETSRIVDFTDNTYFYDVNLNNSIATIEKQDSEMFSFEYQLKISQPNSKIEKFFILDSSMPKSMTCNGDNIVVNYGTKIQVINTSGRLVKEYESNNEIKDIVVGNSLIGIILKNKVEIIKIK